MKIGFTGTSEPTTAKQRKVLREMLQVIILADAASQFHHGDCINADSDAHDIAAELGFWIVIHPPTNPKKRAFKKGNESRDEKPYLDRNKDIVVETELMMSTPKGEEETRSGTWSTIRHAIKKRRPVIVIAPDGTVKER